ncbi:MAG: tellurite resistance/C4-dicarboxylate transporter family protein [Devosia sp.]|nr:tellurite resistance/C4-dicarboxylate transporter family protein [Devosia sp.]
MRGNEDLPRTAGAAAERGTVRTIILGAAETLFPGYFALTMATGVVSIASALLGMQPIAWTLLVINWIAYPSLWGLTLVRVAAFRRQLAGDISDHQRAPGFFTLVAGTCVFGTQNIVVADARIVATLLWWFGLGLWIVVMYGFFTAVTIRARKPSLAMGINGAWLIGAVATQSIVVLRGALDAGTTPPEPIQFIALMMFMIGSMLYLAIIPLIFYRLTFVRLSSRDFSPPYWINMGAVAISTLAGATLIMRAETWPLIKPFLPFLLGFTMFFWSVATWWIPFLLTLMVWRYLWKRDRLAYEPALWGMVFPLGMYTTSTLQLSRAMGFEFLKVVPQVFIYVALAAWVATMAGLLLHIYRSAVTIRARVQNGE